MRLIRRLVLLLSLLHQVLTVPEPNPSPTPVKRQDSELLILASAVGISTLPTDPAELSTITSLVNGITAELPPSPIISVLATGVPSGVLSSLIGNPSYLSSFAGDFAKSGTTPAWYSSLPSSVKGFFSTYSADFGALRSAESRVVQVVSGSGNATATGSATGSTTSGGSTDGGSGDATATTTVSVTTTAQGPGQTTTTVTAGAARGTPGAELLAGMVGAAGILGVVVGL